MSYTKKNALSVYFSARWVCVGVCKEGSQLKASVSPTQAYKREQVGNWAENKR